MAFLPSTQDQTQQGQQQQGQIPTVPQIPTLQGSSGPTASSSSGTQGVTNTTSPGAAPSTPWQNITSYLSANAGQAGNVADVIAGNLQGQYNQANQGIQQAQQNVGQQIEGARNPLNQDLASRAASAPSQVAQNPNDAAAFQKMFSGQYQGPQNFSGTQDYSGLQSQVQNAQKQAALVNGGTPGLMTLLQQAESSQGKNPTQGITSLDSLLLQEDPSNFGKLSAAASPFAGLTGYLSSTQQGLDTAAQNAAKEAAATGSTVQNQFLGPNGIVPNFQNQLNSQLQGLQKQGQTYNNEIADITGRLSGGQQLTPQELYHVDKTGGLSAFNSTFQNALQFPGMSPGMLAQYYSAPANGLLPAPTLANAMTPQQYADAAALNQLLGQSALPMPGGLTNYSIPQDFGTFNDTAAMQGMLDALTGAQSYLPQMGAQGQQDWLSDAQWLQGALGMPSPITPVISPISQPTPVTPSMGGGVVDNSTPPPPIGSTSTGHFAR